MKSLNVFEFVGVSLTVVGSFLPWESAGDPVSIVTNGVWVDIVNFKYWFRGIYEFPVYDYGGVLVLLLTSIIIILTIHPPRLIKSPTLWNLIISSFLMASSLFFVARWLIPQYKYGNVIGKPELEVGLICVVLGSALLLWMAIMTHQQVSNYYAKSAG